MQRKEECTRRVVDIGMEWDRGESGNGGSLVWMVQGQSRLAASPSSRSRLAKRARDMGMRDRGPGNGVQYPAAMPPYLAGL